jgi:hypothetical protein
MPQPGSRPRLRPGGSREPSPGAVRHQSATLIVAGRSKAGAAMPAGEQNPGSASPAI